MKKNQFILSSLFVALSLCFPSLIVSSLDRQLIIPIDGRRRAIDASQFSATVLDALDCSQLRRVDRLTFQGKFFVASPQSDPDTGKVAVGVLLTECVETQQSAVFLIDRNSTTLLQIPGARPLNDPNTTYPLGSISGLEYVDGNLHVLTSDVSGTQSLLMFTNSGEYIGCRDIQPGESHSLCPLIRSY